MVFRSLAQSWLQSLAKSKVREAVVAAAREQLKPSSAKPQSEEPGPCHLGVVFALGIESGCFEDRLEGIVTIRGGGFVVREGGLQSRRVAVILSGPGSQNAARATESLIDGHRPTRVISAGFAGGLSPQLRRNDIVVADRLLKSDGQELPVDLPAKVAAALSQQGVHCSAMLTVDRVVRLPSDKRDLFERYGALAVDMEGFAVAEVCRRRGVPFSSIRVISDTSGETLPRDVEHLLVQTNTVARAGAALGAIWRRPASAKDLYQLHENALIASGRLATFLATCDFD